MSGNDFQMNDFLEQLIKIKLESQKKAPPKESINDKPTKSEKEEKHEKTKFKPRQKFITDEEIAFGLPNDKQIELSRTNANDSSQLKNRIERKILEPIDFKRQVIENHEVTVCPHSDDILLIQVSDESLNRFLENDSVENANGQVSDSFGNLIERMNTKDAFSKSKLIKSSRLEMKLEGDEGVLKLGTNELRFQKFDDTREQTEKIISLNIHDNVYHEVGKIDGYFISN